jgi:DNA polymerase III subunit epsilon
MIVEQFHGLIYTEKRISKDAHKVHGIIVDMLAGQLKPKNVFDSFQQFISNSMLVAHNAVFDITFLRHELWRMGKKLYNRHKCTSKLSRKCYPGLPDYKLETVAKHILGEEADKGRRHRALDDARLTARI